MPDQIRHDVRTLDSQVNEDGTRFGPTVPRSPAANVRPACIGQKNDQGLWAILQCGKQGENFLDCQKVVGYEWGSEGSRLP